MNRQRHSMFPVVTLIPNRMLKPVCFIFFVLLMVQCSTPKENLSAIESINVSESFQSKSAVKLSSIVSQLEYIPLETNPECVLNYPRFYVIDSLILVNDFRQILVFDRTTGKYMRKIGRYGNGPNEYRNTFLGMTEAVAEEKGLVFVRGNRPDEALAFSLLDGRFLFNVNYDFTSYLKDESWLQHEYGLRPVNLNDSLYAFFVKNAIGTTPVKLFLMNNKSQIVKKFSNHQICEPSKMVRTINHDYFHRWEHLYFKETYNDTLYEVRPDSLLPRYVFNLGKYSPPYEKKHTMWDEIDKWASSTDKKVFSYLDYPDHFELWKYMQVIDLIENDNYLFFRLFHGQHYYACSYHKREQKLNISDDTNFENDIDDFMPFYPKYINMKGELVGTLEVPDVLEWFADNPEKASALAPHIRQLKNLKEEDNQIVVIAK